MRRGLLAIYVLGFGIAGELSGQSSPNPSGLAAGIEATRPIVHELKGVYFVEMKPVALDGVVALSPQASEKFSEARTTALKACYEGLERCFAECKRANSESCVLSIHAWSGGQLFGNLYIANPVLAAELAGALCETDDARLCARGAVLYNHNRRNLDAADARAKPLLTRACTKGFQPACRWADLNATEWDHPDLAVWALHELPHREAERIVGCDDAPDRPAIVYREEPAYPESMRLRGKEGRVFIELTVDVTGYVIDSRITRSSNAGFNPNALAAVRRWRYQPASRCGVPLRAYVSSTIIFRLH